MSVIVAAQCCQAQITLTASSFSSAVAGTTDTMKNIDVASLPAVTTGANQVWDFTSVTFSGTFYQPHQAVPSGGFSALAQYADPSTDSIGFAAYYYPKSNMYGLSANGLLKYGEHIDQKVQPMGFYTGNPNDTFTLLQQDMMYDTAMPAIVFPATYLSTWKVNSNANMNGTFYIPGMSYIGTPFEMRYSFTTNDTVTGWGTLKLRNSAGVISAIQVLQVKHSVYGNVQTWAGGVNITSAQKDYTGFPRYMSLGTVGYRYYAANEVTPIVETKGYAAVMLSKNYPPTGISMLTDRNKISVYPNPVSDHTINISLPSGNEADRYELVDMTGRVLLSGKLPASQSLCNVQLPAEMIAGTYFIRISTNNKVVFTEKLIIK